MYPSVKQVKPGKNYILSIVFDNGETGILDMKPFLDFGVFRSLKDHEIFQQVKVNFDTIEWPFSIDLDPEFVYQKCHKSHSNTSCQ